MLGADPGTGKTVFLYRVAEAAAYGKKFVGQLDCVKGNVLVIQKDESDSNMAAKDAKMNVDDPEDGSVAALSSTPLSCGTSPNGLMRSKPATW